MKRFAVGVLKGRPLTYSGPYRVIKWRGEEVALFRGGSMARFYEDNEPEAPTQLERVFTGMPGLKPEEVQAAAAISEVMTNPATTADKAEPSIIPPAPEQLENFWNKIKRWLKEPIF